MSTYWQLYCADCKDTTGAPNLRTERTLMEVVKAAPHLVAALEAAPDLYFVLYGSAGPSVDVEWLRDHQEHRLGIINAYNAERYPGDTP